MSTLRDSIILALVTGASRDLLQACDGNVESTALKIASAADTIIAGLNKYDGVNRSVGKEFRELVNIVAVDMAVDAKDIMSNSKQEPIVLARYMVCLIASRDLRITLDGIAAAVERGKDTVRHALKTAETLVATDSRFAQAADRITKAVAHLAPPPPKPRERNPLFDALADLEGGSDCLTPNAGSRIAKALSLIKAASPDVTPDEIRRRATNLSALFPHATTTANSLSAHWAQCATQPKNPGVRRENHSDADGWRAGRGGSFVDANNVPR